MKSLRAVLITGLCVSAIVAGFFFLATRTRTAVSGVDAFVASVKLGCLPAVAEHASIESFVSKLNGIPLPDAKAHLFLGERKGKAYVLPHPDHQFVLTVFDDNDACTVFARRIDKANAEEKLHATLIAAGFEITHPKEKNGGLYSTDYALTGAGKTIQAVTSFSGESESNFDAVATINTVPPR